MNTEEMDAEEDMKNETPPETEGRTSTIKRRPEERDDGIHPGLDKKEGRSYATGVKSTDTTPRRNAWQEYPHEEEVDGR